MCDHHDATSLKFLSFRNLSAGRNSRSFGAFNPQVSPRVSSEVPLANHIGKFARTGRVIIVDESITFDSRMISFTFVLHAHSRTRRQQYSLPQITTAFRLLGFVCSHIGECDASPLLPTFPNSRSSNQSPAGTASTGSSGLSFSRKKSTNSKKSSVGIGTFKNEFCIAPSKSDF